MKKNFIQNQSKWRHKIIPFEISKNNSDRVVDLGIYKNRYILFKKLNVFLGDHHKTFICRRCLNSYTSENMLMLHKPQCENNDISTIRTSNESHLLWKNHFHKNPKFFRIYADFEADNGKDNSSIGNKTTNTYTQNPILNGYHIESEMEGVLKSGYHNSPLGYNNVDWFVDEVIKLENEITFYFEDTNEDIIVTEKDEEDYRYNKFCRFCEKNIESDRVRDHCHWTGNYRGPAHSICNINATQDQSNFIPFVFHNFIKYDCHIFFKKLFDKKNDKVEFEIIPKTNEECISVTYGCIRFIDSYRFLSSGLDFLVKTLVDSSNETLKNLKNENVDNAEILDIVNEIIEEDKTIKDLKKDYPDKFKNVEALRNFMGEIDLKNLKTEIPDKWKNLTKKIAYPYEHFNSIDDYQKPVDSLKKKDFFSKLKICYADDKEIERTNAIF